MKTISKVLVTPEFCESQLQVNPERLKDYGRQQRHITPSNLRSIQRDMEMGTFAYPQDRYIAFTGTFPAAGKILTAESVMLSGACINGGHRLTASANIGKPFYADIQFECPIEMIETFDRGKSRDDRDRLEIIVGVSHKSSAVIRSIYIKAIQYIRDGDPFSNKGATWTEMDQYADQYVEILQNAVEIAANSPNLRAVYGLLYVIAAKNGWEKEARSFISSVQEGLGLKAGTPAHKLHQRFYLTQTERSTRSPRIATLHALYAFRKHLLGETFHNFTAKDGFDLPSNTSNTVVPLAQRVAV
jgi:hypothetical protein